MEKVAPSECGTITDTALTGGLASLRGVWSLVLVATVVCGMSLSSTSWAAAATNTQQVDPCPKLNIGIADLPDNIETIDATSTDDKSLTGKLKSAIGNTPGLPPTLTPPSNLSASNLIWISGAVVKELDKQETTVKRSDFAKSMTVGLQAACEALRSGSDISSALYTALAVGHFITVPSDSQYTFYIGSVQAMQAQGGFTSNVEASLISRTLFAGTRREKEDDRRLSVSQQPFDGVFELTYSKVGALVSPTSALGSTTGSGSTTSTGSGTGSGSSSTPSSGSGTGSGSGSGSATTATASPQPNPFTSSSGILRVNASLEKQVGSGFGVTAGAGFSTLPQSTGNSPQLQPRVFVAAEFLANYGVVDNADHVTGRVLLGYAHDKFWDTVAQAQAGVGTPATSRRIFVDARIDSPGLLSSKSVKLSVRLFADGPASGHGPADVRISLLASTTFESLFGGT